MAAEAELFGWTAMTGTGETRRSSAEVMETSAESKDEMRVEMVCEGLCESRRLVVAGGDDCRCVRRECVCIPGDDNMCGDGNGTVFVRSE